MAIEMEWETEYPFEKRQRGERRRGWKGYVGPGKAIQVSHTTYSELRGNREKSRAESMKEQPETRQDAIVDAR